MAVNQDRAADAPAPKDPESAFGTPARAAHRPLPITPDLDPPGADALDLFWDGKTRRVFRDSRIETRHTHGTGCTLSAAVAAGLARGACLTEAVEAAVAWVRRAILSAPGLGAGRGPVNHSADASTVLISDPNVSTTISP